MSITIIVACDLDGAIGARGDIPWSAPEDLAHFQRETKGSAVIMGRKTWESLPRAPLPNRYNCVISRTEVPGAHAHAKTPEEALALCGISGHDTIFIIGGAQVYEAFLPLADRLILTRVETHTSAADTFFPDLNPDHWRLTDENVIRTDDPVCTVHDYTRRA